jgi:hypothetical protein
MFKSAKRPWSYSGGEFGELPPKLLTDDEEEFILTNDTGTVELFSE